MGIRVKGLGPTRLNMFRTEQKTTDAMLRFLRESAKFVEGEAKRRAPVDTGTLTEAITSNEGDLDYQRNRRKTIDVYVDPEKLNLEEHDGFDYSVKMHEDWSYDLGPKSRDKQMSDPEVIVGQKYLENAFEDNKKVIQEAAEEVFRRSSGAR